MRSLGYLNGVLTVLTVLLALHLWTAWQPAADRTVGIELTQRAQAAAPGGIPNAGMQRKQMIDLLKQLSGQVSDLNTLLRSGGVEVQVHTPPAQEGDK